MSTTSSDAAEQLVKIYLEGVEVVLRISGNATKNVVAALYAISQDKNKTKGKTRLTSMLKTGKELKIFSIKRDDLKKFSQEAKRYGVLYCALSECERKNKDGMIDIMVRAEDAPKINRIVDRFNLNTLNPTDVKNEIETTTTKELEEGVQEKSKEDLLVEDILSKPLNKEENEITPSISRTEDNQLEPSLKSKKDLEKDTMNDNKPSVKKQLKEIETKLKEQEDITEVKENEVLTPIVNSNNYYEKRNNEKAKHLNNNINFKLINGKHQKNISDNKLAKHKKGIIKPKHLKSKERSK